MSAPGAAFLSDPAAVEDRIRGIVARQLRRDPAAIGRDARLKEELGADSLDLVVLAYEFEETFGVALRDEDAERLKTVAQAARLVCGAARS